MSDNKTVIGEESQIDGVNNDNPPENHQHEAGGGYSLPNIQLNDEITNNQNLLNPQPVGQNTQHIKHRRSEMIENQRAGLTVLQRFQLQQLTQKVATLASIHQELLKLAGDLGDLSLDELDGHERIIKDEWEEFLELQGQVLDFLPREHETAAQETFQRASDSKRETLMNIYRLRGQIKKKESDLSEQKTPSQLTRIQIRPFDGNVTQWKQFSELYKSMIGDRSIPKVEKLVRLKDLVRGPAANLIATFTVTEENYEKAWNKLVRKYEDPRLIAQTLFNRVLELPKINKATADSLSSNAAVATETLDQLISMTGQNKEDLIEQMIAHLLRKSLDADTLKQWELKLGKSKEFPTLKEFTDFVDACARASNANDKINLTPTSAVNVPSSKKRNAYVSTTHQDESKTPKPSTSVCSYCKGNHFIASCPNFTGLTPDSRKEFVTANRLCYNCLRTHTLAKCTSTHTCFTCKRRHHTLIHGGQSSTAVPTAKINNSTSSITPAPSGAISLEDTASSKSAAIVAFNQKVVNEREKPTINRDQQSNITQQSSVDQQNVLLATVQAKALSPKGYSIITRMLIDQGSEVSFISEQLVNQLQLKRRLATIELIGIGGTNSGNTRGVVTVTLQSKDGFQMVTINAHILKKLTARLPTFSCSSTDIGSLENLQLADPNYLKSSPIDAIIGADNYGRIIKDNIVRTPKSHVVGQQTIFGWILSGPINYQDCSRKISLTAVRRSPNEQLLELLQKFWTLEEPPIQGNHRHELSPDEQECETHFKSTHSRDETGRYIVRLPLRTSTVALGDSRVKAARQLQSIIKRLRSDEAYSKLYSEFIKEYESMGHMQRAPEASETTTAYYLPHHGVFREDSITTKLRVVFNGSSPSTTGVSLNDLLYPGGKLQVNAMDVLTWLRKYRFVFGTDIVKMFRQIRINQQDWDLQRILWLDENQQIINYQLTTVTYGLNCSPWLSLRVLQQLVEDEGHRFPAATEALTKGRYVDDIYGGADSPEMLKEIAEQLNGLCLSGGFPLQKWSSNCPQALRELGLVTNETVIQFEETIIKVLGMCWHQSTDTFRFKSKKFTSTNFTKRSMLSEIAQIFDPLGFLAPVVIRGKILIQDLWKIKLNWDDPLPIEYVRRWTLFRKDLSAIDEVSVPRWLRLSSEALNIQIHGFADASTAAMSAVVYVRTKRINEPAKTVLVCSKTRVAPVKQVTIPRLELSAALLLTQLVTEIKQMLELHQSEVHLWSDSSVALAWIQGHPSRWKEFVHNRVAKIQETQPNAVWRHVSGKENPADCASRGISTEQLVNHQLWWSGPDWINREPEGWPQSSIITTSEVAMEAKPTPAHPVAMKVNELAELLTRYQTLSKVLGVTATLNRAIERFRGNPIPETPSPTTEELTAARKFWVKITQVQYFSSVCKILERDNQLPRNHALATLTPILDDEKIIRLGGRLKNSRLDPDEINPIILPRNSSFTTLVIEEAHRRTLHGGTQLTLAQTRQKYWIIGGRNTVRTFIQKCVICTRYRGQQAQQLMGQLPAVRLTPSRAFLHTGVDYAGPFDILKWRPTNASPGSVHIAVFVCFSTSAVHLELVSRQTTEAFLGAYKRFTGRRGIPEVMYSDNAKTFVGASSILNQIYHRNSKENKQLQAALATNGTQWRFTPPKAPHVGGKWEAAVKSVKHHLRRTLGTTTLTFEELNSVLIQIEACLNSRPITPMSDDPDDLQALTPGHFLIGAPLQVLPEPSIIDENPSKLRRWNLVTQKVQQFWSKWSRECLQRYQTLYKWNQQKENIKVGDMVLKIEDNYPPAQWPLARVIATHPGPDGLTRVATIKTANVQVPKLPDGSPDIENVTATSLTFTRPITKLCLLPTDPPAREEPPELIDNEEDND